MRDVGNWGHFVADASQPLHVSVHFNPPASVYDIESGVVVPTRTNVGLGD